MKTNGGKAPNQFQFNQSAVSLQVFRHWNEPSGLDYTAVISPDLALCACCRQEFFDERNHRHLYPFITCADCGTRFTIANRVVNNCPECRNEVRDPSNRRYRAWNVTCPRCGPRIKFMEPGGKEVPGDWRAAVRSALAAGKIVAVKGIGGYHLACDAYNLKTVYRLKKVKNRPHKPLAVMARDLYCVKRWFVVSGREEEVLFSPHAPIVLLKYRPDLDLPESWQGIAPGLNRVGVMMPYSPLHLSLFDDRLEFLVMTSGNLSGQPLIYLDQEAQLKLAPMVDFLLIHDRVIGRPCDDSVVMVNGHTLEYVRRSRGFVPQALDIPLPSVHVQAELLGAGADFKNTFCLCRDGKAFMSQHIGDLGSEEMAERYLSQIGGFQEMLGIFPSVAVCDLHPEYAGSNVLAAAVENNTFQYELLKVQHHHAHMAACMSENGLTGPVVGLIADGTGYGPDGHLWGCEVLVGDYLGFSREAHLEYIPLPGGEAAIKYPWRTAVSYLKKYAGPHWHNIAIELFPEHGEEIEIITKLLDAGVNCPLSCGCGRLFDAVSAMLGICTASTYDGQAAVELGALVDGRSPVESDYRFIIAGGLISPRPVIECIVRDLKERVPAEIIAIRFHEALAKVLAETAQNAAEKHGLDRVVLSGGVFQNLYLSQRCKELIECSGLKVYTHSRVPCNDAGIALGQVTIGLWKLANGGVENCA